MNSKLCSVKEILSKYDQEHLLSFYDELSDEQKEILLDQILTIDFEQIALLYKNSFTDTEVCMETLAPLQHIDKSKLKPNEEEHFKALGAEAIRNAEFAVVTLSGGERYKTWTFWS
ncbi:MAG: hypothetical protein FWC79_04910 [Oscillospiraceae bacterium]|nr:hypothetical protein [Oscillospiraceae bacterium]